MFIWRSSATSRRHTILGASLAVALALPACGRSGSPRDEGGPHPRSGPLTVSVDNRTWNDVRIYVVYAGIRHRLGTVTSMTTSRFRVPEAFGGSTRELRPLADPIASSRTYLSEPILVGTGSVLEWTLGNSVAHSVLRVR